MDNVSYNDLIYVCALIEYIGRKTKNHRSYVVEKLGIDGIDRQLIDAGVNHCLSFEQVSDELIERYGIENGDFDTVSTCRYTVPNYVDIGKLYAIVINDKEKDTKTAEAIKKRCQKPTFFIILSGFYMRKVQYSIIDKKQSTLKNIDLNLQFAFDSDEIDIFKIYNF